MTTVEQFIEQASEVGREFKLRRETIYARSYAAKLRLHLDSQNFIEIYFSQETARTSFALIAADKRIYGADNRGGWHEHPFGQEHSHAPCKEPTLKEFTQKAISLLTYV